MFPSPWIYPKSLPDGKYYKLTKMHECHRGMSYHTGEIIDKLKFNPSGECSAGGMYLFHESQLVHYWKYYNSTYWIREVTFPTDAKIYIEVGKYKCNKFILGERKEFNKYDYLTNQECLQSIKSKFIHNKITPKCSSNYIIWLDEDIKDDIEHLISVLDTDYNLCLDSIKSNVVKLSHVPGKFRDHKLCQEAVNVDIKNLQFIPQTDEFRDLCFEEVRKSNLAIQWVPLYFISYELHLEAVKFNENALQFVPQKWRDLILKTNSCK